MSDSLDNLDINSKEDLCEIVKKNISQRKQKTNIFRINNECLLHITNYLKGIDHIFKAKDGYPIRYAFRFHINPELSVVKTMSGNSALIQISKNKSLLFTINDENVEIEKSIFLGEKKIIDSACITISGNLVNKNKTFNWVIRKNI